MTSYIKTASVMASGELRLSHPPRTNPVQRNCPHGARVSPAVLPQGDVIYQASPINEPGGNDYRNASILSEMRVFPLSACLSKGENGFDATAAVYNNVHMKHERIFVCLAYSML